MAAVPNDDDGGSMPGKEKKSGEANVENVAPNPKSRRAPSKDRAALKERKATAQSWETGQRAVR